MAIRNRNSLRRRNNVNKKTKNNKKQSKRNRKSIRNKRRFKKKYGGSCLTPTPDCLHSEPQAQLADSGHSQVSECAHAYRYGVGATRAGTGGKRRQQNKKRRTNRSLKKLKLQKGGNGDGYFLNLDNCKIGGQAEIGHYDQTAHNKINRYSGLN